MISLSARRPLTHERGKQKKFLLVAFLGCVAVMLLALTAIHMPASTYAASLTLTRRQQDVLQETRSASPAGQSTPFAVARVGNVANALLRINQLDPGQYASAQEAALWSGSACSATSMTEVLNAYNSNHARYRVRDTLAQELAAHAISVSLGLLDDDGIERTMSRFGFHTDWGYKWNLDTVIAIANAGTPVIVSFPPPLWGHILVVRGGDAQNVFLADSSSYNLTVYPRSRFLHYWGGFAAISTPYTADHYRQIAEQAAQQAHISPSIFLKQINQESGFQPWSLSPVGAEGIAQFMPSTAAGIGLNPWNPMAALSAAAQYMAQKLNHYQGDYAKALASYNAGQGATDAAVRLHGATWLASLPSETQNYVQSIVAQ